MVWRGECLTLKVSDLPNDAKECLLSQVLEAHVAPKYSLSPKAANGIISRAERRGKQIPEPLLTALKSLGHGKSEPEGIHLESEVDIKSEPED